MSRVPITKDGEISIKEKLSNLKFVERPQISQAMLKQEHMEILKRMLSIMLQKNYRV